MKGAWLRTIIILPFNVLVVIPCILLHLTGYRWREGSPAALAAGGAAILAGLFLACWTMWLFGSKGRGTPAPWNPPKKLVVAGPYRHVRNPMVVSVLAMLLGEALVLSSWVVFGLFLLFLAANMIYFPLAEEPKLEKRFGRAYLLYKENVPRWLPRVTGWDAPGEET